MADVTIESRKTGLEQTVPEETFTKMKELVGADKFKVVQKKKVKTPPEALEPAAEVEGAKAGKKGANAAAEAGK